MAPVTDRRRLLIVAHGSPSAPASAEAALAGFARAIAAQLAGWRVRGATLAAPGALEAAVTTLGPEDLAVMPHFMADGWFVRTELPRRLAACGAAGAAVLPPFGLLPGLPALCRRRAAEAAAARGLVAERTTLLLAAHGSPSDPRPAQATKSVATRIAETGTFLQIRIGYVDETPKLAEAARLDGPAICLPLFAARGGHVESDIPAALAAAGFVGAPLPPVGVDREAPMLIARTVEQAA